MTCTIHKHIMAVILAGAMILFMGLAAQTVFAEEGEYEVNIAPVNNVSTLLAGTTQDLQADLTKDGEAADLPEGASYKWYVGIMEDQPLPAGFVLTVHDPQDQAKLTFDLPALAEDMTGYMVYAHVEVVKDGEAICTSDEIQYYVTDEFYDFDWPEIDPFMMAGEEATTRAAVTHVYGTEEGIVEEPCKISFIWRPGDDVNDALEITQDREADGSYTLDLKRLNTDETLEFSLTMKYNGQSETMYYWVAGFSTDLSQCTVEIKGSNYCSVYRNDWCYIDPKKAEAAGAPKGITIDDMNIVCGEYFKELESADFEEIVDPESDEVSYVSDDFIIYPEKFIGFDDNDDPVFEPAKFPLVYDKDGTSAYCFDMEARLGSEWTGELDTQHVNVYDKYSLNKLEDNYGASVTFPKWNKYIKYITYDPYWRYEIPKGRTNKPTIKIGTTKLRIGTDVTVKYKNKATKKYVSSFPTNSPGEYIMEITGKAPYYGTYKQIQIKVGAKNTLTVKGKTFKVKASSKTKAVAKTRTYLRSKVLSVKKAQGKVTVTKVSGNSKIKVASNGKVTIKKGLKKGTYKVKVKVKAAGNSKYFPITKKVTYKVKVAL